MTAQTKEELAAENETLKAQLAAMETRVTRLTAQTEGWLITTPNPLFEGFVYGVAFVNGQAFIAKARRVEAFHHEPMKDTAIKMFAPEEQARIRERELISSAEKCAIAMAADFGYKVEFYNLNELGSMQTKIDARAQERAQTEAAVAAANAAKAVVPPGYFGGGA